MLLQKLGTTSFSKFEFIFISLFVAFIMLCILYLGVNFVEDFANILIYDSSIYFDMSYGHFDMAPYTYRILTPFLVYLLPFDHIIGFAIVNFTGLFLTGLLFYYYLKELNFSPQESSVGILFFLLSPTVIYTMFDIALVDALSFFFFLLAFYAILCQKNKLLLFSLVLGILNKETILFTVPLYFLYKLENDKLINTIKSTIWIVLPVTILFIVIRYYFGFTSYFSLYTLKQTISHHIQTNNILNNPYLAFGTLWIISLYNIKSIDNTFLKKSMYVLPFIFLQIFIATDLFRALFIAFPIIIPVSLYLFRIKDYRILIIFLILSIFILFFYLQVYNVNLGLLVTLPLEIIITVTLIIKLLALKGFKVKLTQNKETH